VLGLDQAISELAGGGLVVVLGIALLLGLRHAADPDHLVAVSTLLATEPDRPARRASVLGASWGLGHAATLLALGLPLVLAGARVPAGVGAASEILVGLLIMALAARLAARWRRGGFHAHRHTHGGSAHRHLHRHEPGARTAHGHDHRPARSPLQAFALGAVHGAGGSAAVGLLLVASVGSPAEAAAALGVFAGGAALSMSIMSLVVGAALTRDPLRRRFVAVAPAAAALSFAFGLWYAAGGVHAIL
jgi:cytochrome c biogenesis protein CcdA